MKITYSLNKKGFEANINTLINVFRIHIKIFFLKSIQNYIRTQKKYLNTLIRILY